MNKYKKILTYLPYFAGENQTFIRWRNPQEGSFSYPVYDEKFDDFVKELFEYNILLPNYMEKLESFRKVEYVNDIANMDLETVRALLTYYVRADRFSEGTLGRAAEEKVIWKILKRMEELVGEHG